MIIEEELKRKLNVLRGVIETAFPDAEIELHKKNRVFYRFRIDRERRHPCLIIFTWEYLLNQNENKIVDRLRRSKVFESLSATSKPERFLFTEESLKRVNEKMQEE